MGWIDFPVSSIHARQQLVHHAKDCAHGKDTGRNAEYNQQGATLISPDVKPDLMPDFAHHSSSLFSSGNQIADDHTGRRDLPSAFAIKNDLTISNFNSARHLAGQVFVMGDHDQCLALVYQLAEELKHIC